MRLGLGLSLSNAQGGAAVYDPAVLNLEGWWRASYSASPWTGTASAGSSGSRDLTEATNPPSVGTAVNGRTPSTYDGSSDWLGGAALSTYLGVAAFSGWALVKTSSIGSDSASAGSNVRIIDGRLTNNFLLYLRSSGVVGLGVEASGLKVVTASFTPSAWQLVQFKHTGTAITIRVNNGAWSTPVACGSATGFATTLGVAGYTGYSVFYAGDILEIALSKQTFSDATFDQILSYARSRYALALT